MAKVKGTRELHRKLQLRIDKAKVAGFPSYSVTYSAPYAIYVHENLEAHHDIGQAKFLEQPARANRRKYGMMIADLVKQGKTLDDAVAAVCEQLKLDSQELCPIDTGELRNSAAVRKNAPASATRKRTR